MNKLTDSYRSADGEEITIENYRRWMDRADTALHVLDADGYGDYPEDRQTKLSDLLCHLHHWAESQKVNYAEALRFAEMNYHAETGTEEPERSR